MRITIENTTNFMPKRKVVIENESDELSLYDILEEFQKLLLAYGYIFKGNLTLNENIDEGLTGDAES